MRRLHGNSEAVAALERLWAMEPHPGRAVALQAQIEAAIEAGHVEYAADARGRIGHAPDCPWSPVYAATRSLTLGGRRILKNMRFMIVATSAETRSGTRSRLQLFVGRIEREAL